MASSKLEQTIDDFYESLDDKDGKTLRRIAAAHQRTIDKLGSQLRIVTSKIEDDEKLGLDSGTYILQQQRLASFITEASSYFGEFGTDVGLSLTQGQKDVVKLAESFIPDAIEAINGPNPIVAGFGRLPEGAIQQFVGTLGDGSPLRTLTESFGAESSIVLNRLLLEGVATGINPLQIAQQMANAVPSIGIKRANTIARTEMMRAYRGAAQKVMKANKDIVKGWKWYSALDRGTCVVCWAMHGKIFPVDELMATHPNCRCVQLPVTKSWKELGYDVPEPTLSKGMSSSGEELFSALDPTDQEFILGKAGFTGWKNGLFKLEDFIQDTYSPDWGFGRTTRSVSSMVGKSKTRALSAGKVPRGTAVRPNVLELPANFDPLAPAKKYMDDALQNGKLAQSDFDMIQTMIDTGQLVKPDEIEDIVTSLYDNAVKEIDDLLVEVTHIDALPQNAIDDIVNALENGASVDDLQAIKQTMQEAVKTKKDIIQAEFDDAIHELLMEKQKAQIYGSSNDTLLQIVQSNIDNGVYKTKREVLDAMDLVSKEVKLNDPYAKLISKMDEAGNLNPGLKAQAQSIDVSKLSIQEAKDQWKVWDDLVTQNTPLNYNTVTTHPKFNDLTKLLNDGKITQTEYKTLLQEGGQGIHTNKTFQEAVEALENQAAKKVTKSSYQLMEELQQSGYPQHVKDDLAYKYNTKQINKEQMQMYLDSAPAPSIPPPGSGVLQAPSPVKNWTSTHDALTDAYQSYLNNGITAKEYNAIKKVYNNIGYSNPWGKLVDDDYFYNYVQKKLGISPNPASVTKKGLPYKKHLKDLDDLLNSGTIDQSIYDDVLNKYASGKWKNKQVEQYIQNLKITAGQSGGSTYVPGSVKVRDYQWDYSGWIRKRGADNNRLNAWSRAERDALQTYTGGSYRSINTSLRQAGGDLSKLGPNNYYEDTIRNMDSYFSHARLAEDVKVFRNTSVGPNSPWANPKVGDVLVDHGFTSTSVKPNWSGFKAGGCARASLEIVAIVRQGAKAAWVMPISVVTYEEELLINRGAKFVVTEVVERRPPSGGCLGDYTIYGEYIP